MLRLLPSHLLQMFPPRLRCPHRALIIAAVLLVASVSAVAQEPTQLQDSLDILDAWVANRVLSRGLPGLSIGVVVGDKLVWAHGYGYADLEKNIPVTPRTLFGIRSVTKTFTALAILQLRDAGKLRLSDPVTRYLPRVHILKHSSSSPEITIRELLTHTSGLRRDPPGTDWTDGTYSSSDDLAHPLLQVYEPDTHWYYSNLGFALLGNVVAAVAHEPWQDYVQEHILTPLAMNSTRPVPRRDEPGLAVAYVRTTPGGALAPAYALLQFPGHPTAIDGAGAIASNVEDMAKYVAFHMAEENRSSQVLSGASLREMHRPQWVLPDWQQSWGLGMRVRRDGRYVRIGHAGGGIYQANMYFLLPLKLGVIVLTNSEDDDLGDYTNYAFQLLAPALDGSVPRPSRLLTADFHRFVGIYEAQNHNGRVLVACLDGNLVLLAPDEPNPRTGAILLQSAGEPNVFFQREPDVGPSESPGEKLTFGAAADGAITGFHTDNGRYRRIGPLTSK